MEAAFDFLSKEVEKISQLTLYIWLNHIDKHNILWYIKIVIDSLRVLGETPGQDSPVSERGISHCARCYVCTLQPFSAGQCPTAVVSVSVDNKGTMFIGCLFL